MTTNTQNTLQLRPMAAAIALVLLHGGAYAQTAPDADDGKLGKVVVTANKRAQNLLDVAAAVSVMDDATLRKANVREIDDLPALSPALTVSYSTQPGNFSINMRGIGTYSLGIGVEADVSIIIDDIPIGMQANAFKDLADVFRIEVLKGPQSTLFGKSAIAGALNITTKPIGGPLTFKTSTLLTNDKEWRLGASVSGSANEQLRFRVAASTSDYDGTVKNLTTGKGLNGGGSTSLIGKFEWAALPNLDITLSPRWSKSDKTCCVTPFTSMTPGGLYNNIAALPATEVLRGIQIGPRNVSVRNDYPAGGKSHDAGAGLKLNYSFNDDSVLKGHVLSSISSYSKYHMDDFQDGDATDSNILKYTLVGGKPSGFEGGLRFGGFFNVKSATQELRLTSPDAGPFRYVAGLWYGRNALDRQFVRGPTTSTVTAYLAETYNTSYAVFGQSSFDIRPDTSLITGLRLNREDTGYGFTRYTPPPAALVPTEFITGEDSHNDITGRIALEHRLDKNGMVYASYSTGHKGVAYDLTSTFSAAIAKLQPVPAETAKNFELGYKASLLDNRAMLSIALFKTNFFGFQQSAGFLDPDGIFRTTLHSIGELQTRGVEVDGSMRVTPAWSVNGALAYTEATIQDFENGPCHSLLAPSGVGTVRNAGCAANPKFNNGFVQNMAGKTLPNAPKVKVNLGSSYDWKLADTSFTPFLNTSYRWQSATQFSLNQDPMTIQGGYGIFNLGAGLRDKQGRYTVTFNVNNLFDKTYAAGLGNALGHGNWSTSAPNPVLMVNATTWTPPRDYRRYFSLRLDTTF
jgi:iron complex outermembrane receptor protein